MPKIVKIPLIILALFLGLSLILLGVVQTSWFKNYITKKATTFLSKELGVTVSIGHIDIDYFDRLEAQDVFVMDQDKDSMIYLRTLKANYDLFSFTSNRIAFDKVVLDHANVNLGITENEQFLNIQFLIDYFTPPKDKQTGVSPTLEFKEVELINSRFHYYNKNFTPPTSRSFDENDMVFNYLNGTITDFTILNDSLNFDILDLSGIEKSGLSIKKLAAKTIISSTVMNFQKLVLETEKSTISEALVFKYSAYKDFSDFIEVVQLQGNLVNAKIHTDDLSYFTNNLKSYNELLTVSGEITGTIANISSKQLDLAIGSHTSFSGAGKLVGLPNIDKTYLDINSKRLTTNATDLARLIELKPAPKEFINLGSLQYIGSFKGYISDFKAIGDISSDIGNVKTNLHYQHQKNPIYKGQVSSSAIQLNELLGLNDLGIASFDIDIDGRGITLKDLQTKITGNISKFEFDNYVYQNITVNGDVANNIYNGIFAIYDPNFNLNFNGQLDATKKVPLINVTTNVAAINLKTLGLDSADNIVRFNGKINLEGSTIDNLVGKVELDSFQLKTDSTSYSLKQITLESKLTDVSREYIFKSNLGNAQLTGDFLPSEFGTLIKHIEHIVNPLQFEHPNKEIRSKNFVLDVKIEKYNTLFNEYLPGFLFDSARLFVNYDHQLQKVVSNNKVFKPDYEDVNSDWVAINFNNSGDSTPINYSINSAGLSQKDSVLFDVLNAHGFIEDGIVTFETTSSKDSILEIILAGRYLYKNDSSLVYVDDSKVDIYNKSWVLRPSQYPNIISSKGVTEFRQFDFRNGSEILFFDASLGNSSDNLSLFLTDFKLENFTPFLAGYDINLSGSANGFVDVSSRQGHPFIESDLEILNLQLNNDTLGDLSFSSNATEDLLRVNIVGSVTNGLLNDLRISGNIDFNNVQSPLNLTLETTKSSIRPFEKYLTGLASGINGYSTTNIQIVGPISKPKLTGQMVLEDLDFMVDYLQTRYTASAIIDVTYNSFTIRESKIKDRFKKEGKVIGKVTHNNYNNFKFDINITDLKNFEIMNTKRKDNDLFYGTAFVDGQMQVKGPMDDILLIINAKSRKGTVIEIPLDNFEASGKLSYVEFVDITKDNNSLTENINTASGVRMDFNFEVTNDASVTLVFDELLGDKINATAHGNLRMEINTFGDFNMYGGLTIDEGNYLFTAFDLINKYFTVTPGGTLFWDGNPYNATINLQAIKREYPVPSTLLDGIVPNEELANYGDAIPVDCILQLKGLLFNPSVSFDLSFPSQSGLGSNNNTELTTVIERIKLDQEELNRQVFALLVLGTFIPPSFATGSVYNAETGALNSGINSLSDFASSQLNNWLSQLDSKLKVGFDFQNSTESQRSELIISLKRKFLNDRLELAYSVDATADAGSMPYDFNVQYNISKDGSFKAKGFQKNANDPTLGNLNNITTTGVGLYYRYQFDKFRFRRKKKVVE